MAEPLDSKLKDLDRVPANDVWSRVGTGSRGEQPAGTPRSARLAAGVTALVIAVAAFALLLYTFRGRSDLSPPLSSGSGTSAPASSEPPGIDRVGPYVGLIRTLARSGGKASGSLYIRIGICDGSEDPPIGTDVSRACEDAFSESEQQQITEELSSLGMTVRFVSSVSFPANGIYVWVGPLEVVNGTYRAGAGMWCGGDCGQGGLFQPSPDGGGWEMTGRRSWIS